MPQVSKFAARLMVCTALGMLAAPAYAADLRFWTTEEQPERLAKQREIAAAF